MRTRKFIASIYLYQEKAVKSLSDSTVIAENPVELAREYCEKNADEILVYDLSNGDAEHDAALDVMKAICAASPVDVYGAGNVHRMEDIKKILYTGCKKAVLNFSKKGNREIIKEVSQKFGREKILAAVNDLETLTENKELLEEFASGLLFMNPHMVREAGEITELPAIVETEQLALNKLLEIFGLYNVMGITGNAINDNKEEILQLKDLCKENGIAIEELHSDFIWDDFKKNSDGMVPVVVQDYKTLEVLMVAYMNEEAYKSTLKTGKMTYYSRSRKELWLKGETSGHYQYVKSLTADCDKDTILAKVFQIGNACHTGSYSCFFRDVVTREYEEAENPLKVFEEVYQVILDRKKNPKEGSYTNYLFDKGLDKILKKLGEEATEIVIAAKNPNPNEVKYEISDFLYHMMVLMAQKDISWEEITTELANR